MTPREENVFEIIRARPGCTAADIAGLIGVERRTVNALLVLMEASGDVRRARSRGRGYDGDLWFPMEGAGLNG